MKSIAVLMSTYNGEKFLREQLDSILAQKEVKVGLFVRDDGSSDGTKEILNEYAEQYPNIYLDFAENVGVGNSFMNLLYSAPDDFDYYAFADQDDIWEETKLAEAIRVLEENKALLYASNQECVDKEGNSLGMRWRNDDERVFLTPEGILCQNVLCGCTMVLTNTFREMLKTETVRPSSSVLNLKNHDGWIAIVAAMLNGIIYDNRSFIKYRQHGGNVVGAYSAKFGKRMKAKFKKLFHKELRNYRSNTARELCAKFPQLTCKFPLIEICANSIKYKGKRTIIKNQNEIRKYTDESVSKFRLKVLFGLF